MLTADTPSDSARQFACLACALLGLIAWSVMAPAAVLDQAQDATSSNISVGPSDQRIAQTFTPAIDGKLEKVRLRIGYLPAVTGDAGDLLLEVMNGLRGAGFPCRPATADVTAPHGAAGSPVPPRPGALLSATILERRGRCCLPRRAG